MTKNFTHQGNRMVNSYMASRQTLVAIVINTFFLAVLPSRSWLTDNARHVRWSLAFRHGENVDSPSLGGSPSAHGQSRHSRKNVHALGAFPWFGGSEEEKKEETKTVPEESEQNLEGVANIMDSMTNFGTAQEIGDRTSTVLQDLSNILVEGSSKEGKVKVTYNGQQLPVGVQIDEAYFQSLKSTTEGSNELCEALSQAMQDAHSKSTSKMDEKLKSLYSDLGFESS